ncbi:hypothetical protein [Peptostreptococcus sp. D1]|uniref:hypothetical protein n=1 Tax=Peptostreptococcus sp. D1 TaxID=72304 RepID=UPI0008E841C7|nr:hypothetical protein [Peptostreptococcus sp. D1]SFE16332.1 hypothetical protein SAMN02910278_00087 [Peptostreptococcus sp. D1]
MKKIFESIKSLSFLELYFRLICLVFWPIYWYDWIVITIQNYNLILFNIYFAMDIIFIVFLIIKRFVNAKATKWYFCFMLTTSLAYLVSLYSNMIAPRDVTFLYIKIMLCLLMIFSSWRLIKAEENDVGVVGVLSGILLLVLTYFY